jgi:group I intron endonuclease
MIKFGIYLIRNVINGKKYVGSTGSSVGFNRRWMGHKKGLRGDYHYNPHFQHAWNKYGESNFEWIILEECNDDMLIAREQAWINYYDSMNLKYGYNIMGADRHIVSKETRRKMSESQKGNTNSLGFKHSEEYCKNISISLIGNKSALGSKHSEETKRNMSLKRIGNQYRLGHKHTAESKEKMSEARLKRYGKKLFNII